MQVMNELDDYTLALQKTEGHTLDLTTELDHCKLPSLKQAFEELGGSLRKGEFVRVLTTFLDNNTGRTQQDTIRGLLAIFRVIDINDNGDVDWQEFQNYIQKSGMTDVNQLRIIENDFGYTPSTTVTDKISRWDGVEKVVWIPALGKLAIVEEKSTVVKLYNWNLDPETEKILPHKHRIVDFAFVKDKNYIAVVTVDKRLTIWDSTSSALHTAYALRHTFPAELVQSCVCWNSSKRLLFTGSIEGPMNVWNLDEFHHVARLTGHKDLVTATTDLENMGDAIASCSLDGTIRIWDTVTLTCVKVLHSPDNKKGVTCLSSIPQLQMLCTGGIDHDIYIWNPYVQNLVARLRGHAGPIVDIKCDPETLQCLSVDEEGMIKLWDLRTYQCLDTFVASSSVSTVQGEDSKEKVDESSTQAIVGSSGASFGNIKGGGGSIDKNITSLDLMPEHKRFVASGRRVYYFDGSIQKHQPFTVSEFPVQSSHYNEYSSEFFTVASREIKVWDATTGAPSKTFKELEIVDEITAFGFSYDKRKFVIGTNGGDLKVFASGTGAFVEQLTGRPGKEVAQILMDHETKSVIAIFQDGVCQIHKTGTLIEKGESDLDRGFACPPIASADYSAVCSLIVVGCDDNKIRMYDFFSCNMPECTLEASTTPITCVKFLPGLPVLLVAEANGTISFWSTRPLPYKNEKLLSIKAKSPKAIEEEKKRRSDHQEYLEAMLKKQERDQLEKERDKKFGNSEGLLIMESERPTTSGTLSVISSEGLDGTERVTKRLVTFVEDLQPQADKQEQGGKSRELRRKPGKPRRKMGGESQQSAWQKSNEEEKMKQMRRRSSVAVLDATVTEMTDNTATATHNSATDPFTENTEHDLSSDEDDVEGIFRNNDDVAGNQKASFHLLMQSSIESMAFVRSTRTLLVGDDDGYVTAFDLANLLHKLNLLTKPSKSNYVSPSSGRRKKAVQIPTLMIPSTDSMRTQQLASNRYGARQQFKRPTLSIKDVTQMNHFKAHNGVINCLSVSDEPVVLLSSSFDQSVKVWKPTGEALGILCPENESDSSSWKFSASFYSNKRVDTGKVMNMQKMLDKHGDIVVQAEVPTKIERVPPKLNKERHTFFAKLKTVQKIHEFPLPKDINNSWQKLKKSRTIRGVLKRLATTDAGQAAEDEDHGKDRKTTIKGIDQSWDAMMSVSKSSGGARLKGKPADNINIRYGTHSPLPNNGISPWDTESPKGVSFPKIAGAKHSSQDESAAFSDGEVLHRRPRHNRKFELSQAQIRAADRLNQAFENAGFDAGEYSAQELMF